MHRSATMLPIQDLFGFLEQQTGIRNNPYNTRFWFHSSRGDFVMKAMEDDHEAIESCPSSFGLKTGRVVFEMSPVPNSRGSYFLAGVFRVTDVSRPHPVYANCDAVSYREFANTSASSSSSTSTSRSNRTSTTTCGSRRS